MFRMFQRCQCQPGIGRFIIVVQSLILMNDDGSHPRMRLHKSNISSSSCSMIDFPTIELETCTNFDKGLVLFASFCAILVAIKQIKKYIDNKDSKIAEKED